MKPSPVMTLRERSHWIFDLDGTLTVAVHDFAFIRSELGVPDGSDILGHLSAIPHQEAQPLHARLQEIELGLTGATTAAAGSEQLLRQLKENGARLGILTRNTRENALRTLDLVGLGDFFVAEDILGRDQALPKPDPDGIIRLAVRWGTEPAAAVMVGDYLYDLQAGRLAGAMTVHVDSSRSFIWPELSDVTVGTLEELLPQLQD
jgi:HAD superfamily hydrolase (TIGR01509 family)